MTDREKKKPRMTCKQYCPVWNDIDKDCEIYGEHHFTPRTCPHYNIEILEKMKMAEMYNKFIEENYDTQNTKNEQQKDLCITSEQLTEQMHKGELPEGWYFVILNNGKVDIAKCSNLFINCGRKLKRNFAIDNVAEVIEPICYEKWQAVNQNMDSVMRTNQALCQKLTQLKELLKECELWFTGIVGNMNDKNVGEHNKSVPIGNFEYAFKVFSQKINEVLK